MNVTRLLHAEFARQKVLPFSFGDRDCLRWCADCAALIIGRDPALHLIGHYDSESSARRLMVEKGWADMGDVAASMFQEIAVSQARTGDWAQVVNEDGTDGLGVVVGAQIVGRAQQSLGFNPLTRARRAFRVA